MSTDVLTLREDTEFKEVVRLLAQRDVSGAPVVDGSGRVLGVVSHADLLVKQSTQEPSWTRSPLTWLHRRRNARRAGATTAGRLMTEPAITIDPESTVVHAARVLSRHNVKRLPVTDSDGTLVGIVSRKDLLTVFLRKDEDIRDYIIEHVFEFGLGLTVSAASVWVTVHDGKVTLDGRLDLKSQVDLAEEMVRHIDGVVDVATAVTFRHDDTRDRIPEPMTVNLTHEPWRA